MEIKIEMEAEMEVGLELSCRLSLCSVPCSYVKPELQISETRLEIFSADLRIGSGGHRKSVTRAETSPPALTD